MFFVIKKLKRYNNTIPYGKLYINKIKDFF